MSRNFNLFYIFLSFIFILYLLFPAPGYPDPLPEARRSTEPADQESTLRRGYYTDIEREAVMEHYLEQFEGSGLFNIKLPTYRLNYPPEEAQVIIRDQTRSTFLEEIVHPFRESLYVNGFKPQKDNEVIIVEGYQWLQKIIVKMVPSSTVTRLIVGVLTASSGWLLIREFFDEIKSSKNTLSAINKRDTD